MKGLQTSRCVLIDDQPSEALPIIQALSSKGIGSLYFQGLDGIPDNIQGIRLIVADMHILPGTSHPSATLAPIISCIKKIKNKESTPVIILIWSSHENLRNDFTENLGKYIEDVRYLVISMDKNDYYNKRGDSESGFDIDKLIKDINNKIESFPPLDIFMNFEQFTHDSITKTVEIMFGLAINGNNWQDEMYKCMAKLLYTFGGTSLSDPKRKSHFLALIYNAFYVVMSDYFHNQNTKFGNFQECVDSIEVELNKLVLNKKSDSNFVLDSDSISRLNSAVNISQSDNSFDGILQGSVYTRDTWHASSFPVIDSHYSYIPLDEFIKTHFENADTHMDYLRSIVTPVLIEITPDCDHAQNKVKVYKFLTGVIVLEKHLSDKNIKIKKSDNIKNWGLINLRPGRTCRHNGIYRVIVNSLYSHSLHKNHIHKCTPVFRFRRDAVLSLRSWFNYMNNRIGDVIFY